MLWKLKPPPASSILNVRLEGERLIIRPPQMKDWPAWAEVRGRNRLFLKALEPAWPNDALSRDFFLRRLQRQKRDWEDDRAYSFLVFKKYDNALIGGVNINHVARGAAQYASLGYWLDERKQGQGFMAEALKLVIRYAFEELRLHRVQAACLPENERSANLLLKLGFEEEGFAERYVQIDGKWRDHRLFGLPVEKAGIKISSA